MKGCHGLSVVASAATALVLSLFPHHAPAAETTVLTFNRWTPATHHFHARIMKPWADRVEEATQGRVKIQFTAASLGSPARQFDLARTGVVDIAASNQSYTAERFPLAGFAELPFLSSSAEALSVANWRGTVALQKQVDEYQGTKLLTVFSNGPGMIFTRNKAVNAIADLENVRVRASEGIPARVAALLGAVPVSAPVTEAYQMLSKGIIESILLPPDSIHSFKMDQYLKHMTTTPDGLFSSTFFVVMNEAKWNALPEQDRQAIMSVSGESFAREAGRVWDDQDKMALAAFKEGGMDTHVADEALAAEIRKRLAPLEKEWLAQAKAKGVDGEQLLTKVRADIGSYGDSPATAEGN